MLHCIFSLQTRFPKNETFFYSAKLKSLEQFYYQPNKIVISTTNKKKPNGNQSLLRYFAEYELNDPPFIPRKQKGKE